MRYVLMFAAVLMFASDAVVAQEETVEENRNDETGVTENNDFRMYTEPVAEHEGDTVILTDGRRLEDVQVLRRTSTDYEIEVVEGAPPMALPRDIVSEIIWDDYDPLGLNLGDMDIGESVDSASPPEAGSSEALTPDEEGNVEILPGKKVPAELAGRLRKDITALVPQLSGKDIFAAFKTISQAIQIQVVVDKPLREMANKAADGLKVDISVKDDATVNVAQFFYNYLFKQPEMKNLDIVYMPNRMTVTTKEAAKEMRAELSAANEKSNGEEGVAEEETDENL